MKNCANTDSTSIDYCTLTFLRRKDVNKVSMLIIEVLITAHYTLSWKDENPGASVNEKRIIIVQVSPFWRKDVNDVPMLLI